MELQNKKSFVRRSSGGRFFCLTAGIAATALVLSFPAASRAGTVAADDASQSAYSGSWNNGSNGGFGWGGGWALTNGSTAGFFVYTSTQNAGGSSGGIDTGSSPAQSWGEYANNSPDVASAVRPFPKALRTGDVFALSMDNGYLNSGGTEGFGLQNANGSNVVEFFFVGGQSYYQVNDAAGVTNTNLSFSGDGLLTTFTLTSATTFQLRVYEQVSGTSDTITGTLIDPGNGQDVSQVRMFNAFGGNGSDYNAYFNSIAIYDTTPPAVSSINRAGSSPTAATSVDFTVTFDDAVTGVATNNFTAVTTGTFTGGPTVSNVTGSGDTYTVTVTYTTGSGDLGLRLDQNLGNIVDLGGNALSSGLNVSQTYVVSSSGPEVTSITRADASPTNATSVNYTVTFSEPVSGVTTSNFSLVTTGTATGNVASVAGVAPTDTWTVTVNSVAGDGGLALSLSDGTGIQNGSSQPLATTLPFTGESYQIDNTGPAPTLSTSVAPVTSVSPFTVDITFNEDATGFSAAGVNVTNGTKSNFQTIDARHYSIDVTPTGRQVSVQVLASAATDSLGNPSSASSVLNVATCGDDTVVVDGVNSATTDLYYHLASNSAPGIDTNTNSGFAGDGYITAVRGADDEDYLYLFFQGTFDGGNKLFAVIDSDASSATGFSGQPPSGTYGETNALHFFTGFPTGGYDLAVVVSRDSGSNASYLVVLAYDSAGAVADEQYLGSGTASGGSLAGTVRGITGTLTYGFNNGGGADQGVELKIPRNWMLDCGGHCADQYRVVGLIGNGGNNYWSNVTIPQNSVSGNIGFTTGVNDGALTGLTAPIFQWSSIDTTPPSITSITPSTTGPTTQTSIDFAVQFSECVVNFDPTDVTVTHTGTASTGLTVTGGPILYTVTVSGISGTGSFTITVNQSDIQDNSAQGLSAGSTSPSVTIGPPTAVENWKLF